MAHTPLKLLKSHVRADDFEDDDAYLASILEVAESAVIRRTNRPEEDLLVMGGGQFPKELTHAVLLLAGEWYAQREAASSGERRPIPFGVDALIRPFCRLRP